ncbi:MAG: peptidyl-prolyl cis-trans isomerase, partial [Paracoccus sp. (in: a-proteobacteria)]|nr:peptidyl-prolyl cis-trans isomerase [Paracoccus sp. (in: a-proteobacteria)]
QLFTRATLEEEARKIGVSVGDRQVATAITRDPSFQGPGGFSRAAYSEVLRRQGLTEERYEREIRGELAAMILHHGVVAGVAAPAAQADLATGWVLERRDISWHELSADDLPAPVALADEDALRAWHQANADRFTAPEIRKITYVWLTPEMLAETVALDEAALREIYDARAAEYIQPERRMVGRLVFESTEAAEAARARLDSGAVNFETLAGERGLTLADTDLGERTEAELGAAGATVFAAADNGVVGPVQSDLGPALYAVNAILDPVNISFDEALPDLRAEAAADRARRLIGEHAPAIEDELAGGASLEQIAEETEMQLARIDWSSAVEPVPGEIGGYPAFRDQAGSVSQAAYPELFELDDGGIFALRLDEVIPPALIPFEDVRDAVAEDWTTAETHRQLVALAEDMKLKAVSATMPQVTRDGNGVAENGADGEDAGADDLPLWNSDTGLLRDGWLEHAPPSLLRRAFTLEEGETELVDDGARVALVRVDRIEPALLEGEGPGEVKAMISDRLDRSLANDMFDYFTRAIQSANGVTLNQPAIAAVESQM